MRGVGFLRSMDGGADLDPARQHEQQPAVRLPRPPLRPDRPDPDAPSAGVTSAYKVVVDPHPTPDGNVIIYAALGGLNGGLWRSVDTGNTWQKLSDDTIQGTIATDVVLDLQSATVDALNNPTGNVNTIYVAFQGAGTQVYSSPNRGQTLNPMTGSNFDAFIQEGRCRRQRTDPAGPAGHQHQPDRRGPRHAGQARPRRRRRSPTPTSRTRSTRVGSTPPSRIPSGVTVGLFLTKDSGATWTLVHTEQFPLNATLYPTIAVPTNDQTRSDYDVTNSNVFSVQGNYNLSLAVDPTNPNIVYFGGTSDGQTSGPDPHRRHRDL